MQLQDKAHPVKLSIVLQLFVGIQIMQLDLSLHITFTAVVRFQIPSSKEASHGYLDQLYIKLWLFYFFLWFLSHQLIQISHVTQKSTSPLWRPDLKLLVYHKKKLMNGKSFLSGHRALTAQKFLTSDVIQGTSKTDHLQWWVEMSTISEWNLHRKRG